VDRIGIVGGAGFIGSALARHLSKSFVVKILDKKPMPKDFGGKLEYQSCDLREYDDVQRGLEDVDLVIHTAIIQIPLINEAKRLGYEVNILGTQNICEAIEREPTVKGMILAGSWHVVGERELRGVIDEEFGFRPDKVEDRARLYALCKIGQEMSVRVFDEISEKIYGIIRMGTVLGEGMPRETAAAKFLINGLAGKPLTPYKHSMHRPMLYVDVNDICEAFEAYAKKILDGKITKRVGKLSPTVNVYWPLPITVIELAETIRSVIIECSNGNIEPRIEIVDKGQRSLFNAEDKNRIKVDISKLRSFLGLQRMTSPKETTERLVKEKLLGARLSSY